MGVGRCSSCVSFFLSASQARADWGRPNTACGDALLSPARAPPCLIARPCCCREVLCFEGGALREAAARPAVVEVHLATYVSPSSGLCLAIRDSFSGLCKPGLNDSYTLALDACDTVDAFAMGFALLASAAPSTVLTDTGASALLAMAALSPMLTDTGASALLAPAALSPMLTRLRRHRSGRSLYTAA